MVEAKVIPGWGFSVALPPESPAQGAAPREQDEDLSPVMDEAEATSWWGSIVGSLSPPRSPAQGAAPQEEEEDLPPRGQSTGHFLVD